MTWEDALKTKLQRGKPESLLVKRMKRIREAIGWKKGSRENPRKHVVTNLPGGLQVYFLKPGKEAFNVRRPNPHDMTPVVGSPEERPTFTDIWSCLSEISLKNFEIFRAVLTLIYRNAYMLDHVEKREGIRYEPSKEVSECIEEMNNEIGDILPFGLMGFLHFLDILGWNEDVKYHIENGEPTFTGKYPFRTGRINTLLTCIRVPYQASIFIKEVVENVKRKREINFKSLFTIMQQFANSRGTCVPTKKQLLEWLYPYIEE